MREGAAIISKKKVDDERVYKCHIQVKSCLISIHFIARNKPCEGSGDGTDHWVENEDNPFTKVIR